MAAAKETPRQKMIGMIYLVLTALLALNVSSTVLDKFAFINESLQRANAETTARNINTIGRMKESVEERGNREEDLRVIADVEALRARTGQVFQTLQEYKETFVDITGGYEEGREGDMRFINGKTDYDEVGHYMMSKQEGGEGHGETMKQELNDYADYVKEILEKNGASEERLEAFRKMAKDAVEDEI